MSDSWKSPGTFIGIAGLILSIIANIYQYSQLQLEKAKNETEISKGEAQITLLHEQVSTLNIENREFKRKLNEREELSGNIKKEIIEIDNEIENLLRKISGLVNAEYKYKDDKYWIDLFYHDIDSLKQVKSKKQMQLNAINNGN